jgi:hypothetical protein
MISIIVGVHGFKGSGVQGFKVSVLSLDCIWDAYLRENVNFIRPNPK